MLQQQQSSFLLLVIFVWQGYLPLPTHMLHTTLKYKKYINTNPKEPFVTSFGKTQLMVEQTVFAFIAFSIYLYS